MASEKENPKKESTKGWDIQKYRRVILDIFKQFFISSLYLVIYSLLATAMFWFGGSLIAVFGSIIAGVLSMVFVPSIVLDLDKIGRSILIMCQWVFVPMFFVFTGWTLEEIQFMTRAEPRSVSLTELVAAAESSKTTMFRLDGVTVDMRALRQRTHDHPAGAHDSGHSYEHAVVPVTRIGEKASADNRVWAVCEDFKKGYDLERCKADWQRVNYGAVLVNPREIPCYEPVAWNRKGSKPVFVKLVESPEAHLHELWAKVVWIIKVFLIVYGILALVCMTVLFYKETRT